jgi:hypothetical protein
MVRLRSFLWLSALLALVGGPSVARTAAPAWAPVSALRHGPADAAPESYVRAVAKWHTALDGRTRKDSPPLAHVGRLPAGPTAPRPLVRPRAGVQPRAADAPSAPDGQYPIFTTGPPSQA